MLAGCWRRAWRFRKRRGAGSCGPRTGHGTMAAPTPGGYGAVACARALRLIRARATGVLPRVADPIVRWHVDTSTAAAVRVAEERAKRERVPRRDVGRGARDLRRLMVAEGVKVAAVERAVASAGGASDRKALTAAYGHRDGYVRRRVRELRKRVLFHPDAPDLAGLPLLLRRRVLQGDAVFVRDLRDVSIGRMGLEEARPYLTMLPQAEVREMLAAQGKAKSGKKAQRGKAAAAAGTAAEAEADSRAKK